jgi:hypothetical protein
VKSPNQRFPKLHFWGEGFVRLSGVLLRLALLYPAFGVLILHGPERTPVAMAAIVFRTI